jgi:hypothetical protein
MAQGKHVSHNAVHYFNTGLSSVPSTSILSQMYLVDPRKWVVMYEPFTQISQADLPLENGDFPQLYSGQWASVVAADDDLTATQGVDTGGNGTLIVTCEGSADDSGFVQMDGGNYRFEANRKAVFEARLTVTATLATGSWFCGMGPIGATIDQLLAAGGADFTPVSYVGVYGHDSTGATARYSAFASSVESAMGTATITTAVEFTSSIVWDGVTAVAYHNGQRVGTTSGLPTAGLTPVFGMEDGASSGGVVMAMNYMLFASETDQAGGLY